MPMNGDDPVKQKKKLRPVLWALVSALIAGATVWAVTSQWKHFSLADLARWLGNADPVFMALAVLCMFGFVFFEGCALAGACRTLEYPAPLASGCSWAAADIYFSAITPSASGGQPACALLMARRGIPPIVATAVLLLTLAMYALSILTIGVLCALAWPWVFGIFGPGSRVLIVVGFLAQILLATLLFLMLRSEQLLEKLLRGTLRLLIRLGLIRRGEEKMEKLTATMEEYRRCAALLSGHRGLLLRSFAFNLLQRASLIAVTMFTFLAMGGPPRLSGAVFAMESCVVIGSNCVPVPGAMGVADYLLLDGFEAFLPPDMAVSLELVSRSVSFYCCVLLCGLVALIASRKKRKE